jgi:hypothetical protein
MKEPDRTPRWRIPASARSGICAACCSPARSAPRPTRSLSRRRPRAQRPLGGSRGPGLPVRCNSEPLIKAGKLKPTASSARRSEGLPDLPTMGEAGYKKLDLEFWHMLLAPAGTPGAVIHRVNAALPRACRCEGDGHVRQEQHGALSADAWTPEAAAALLSREINLWSDDPHQRHPGAVERVRKARMLSSLRATFAVLPASSRSSPTPEPGQRISVPL